MATPLPSTQPPISLPVPSTNQQDREGAPTSPSEEEMSQKGRGLCDHGRLLKIVENAAIDTEAHVKNLQNVYCKHGDVSGTRINTGVPDCTKWGAMMATRIPVDIAQPSVCTGNRNDMLERQLNNLLNSTRNIGGLLPCVTAQEEAEGGTCHTQCGQCLSQATCSHLCRSQCANVGLQNQLGDLANDINNTLTQCGLDVTENEPVDCLPLGGSGSPPWRNSVVGLLHHSSRHLLITQYLTKFLKDYPFS